MCAEIEDLFHGRERALRAATTTGTPQANQTYQVELLSSLLSLRKISSKFLGWLTRTVSQPVSPVVIIAESFPPPNRS